MSLSLVLTWQWQEILTKPCLFSLFLAYHKDPLHCPQKCLTLLCWVSVYQETNNPAIGGLAQTLIQQNSRDVFSLPAFTHHLQTTMKLPQKQKKINAFMSNPCLLLKLWNRIIFFFLYSAAKCLGNFVTEAITCKWNYVLHISFTDNSLREDV